jgi:OOP family OmpA-OmpF porin
MTRSKTTLWALAGILSLSMVAGCAETSPPQAAHSASEPELAGAWYVIYFDSNKVDINDRGQMIVKTVAYIAKEDSSTRVTVIGKTDRVGNASTNLSLSQRRADGVRDELISAGVPAGRIDTTWTGEARQSVATSDDEAERRNRVVDITVVKPQP